MAPSPFFGGSRVRASPVLGWGTFPGKVEPPSPSSKMGGPRGKGFYPPGPPFPRPSLPGGPWVGEGLGPSPPAGGPRDRGLPGQVSGFLSGSGRSRPPGAGEKFFGVKPPRTPPGADGIGPRDLRSW